MNTPSEFTLQLVPQLNIIQLSGNLPRVGLLPSIVEELRVKLAECPPESKWTVDAEQVTLGKGSAQWWIEIVDCYLQRVNLVYSVSQLGMILMYDEDYRTRYPAHTFLEEDLIHSM